MKLKLSWLVLIYCWTVAARPRPTVELIVFSKNRPLQLYAFLESCKRYVVGLDTVSVIYCSDEPFAQAYKEVHACFATVRFMQQAADNPYADFKKLLCDTVCLSRATHIIFAVDDIVVIDTVDIHRCATLLEKYRAYGFYLRLGTDITECYAEECSTGTPKLKLREQDVYSWKFKKGCGDWAYPHTVDMTLFRAEDVYPAALFLDYDSPNMFECAWAAQAKPAMKRRGLCCAKSKIVNLPLNLVQQDFLENRHSSECDVHFLLEKFQQGFRMDIQALHQFPHKAPHADYVPTFIPR